MKTISQKPTSGKATQLKRIDNTYQPSKAELEADVSIHTTPDDLLKAVINYNPRKDGS